MAWSTPSLVSGVENLPRHQPMAIPASEWGSVTGSVHPYDAFHTWARAATSLGTWEGCGIGKG
nr:hypothetical protein StreXyl84_03240 [Streptomyces sp. Xyl84]